MRAHKTRALVKAQAATLYPAGKRTRDSSVTLLFLLCMGCGCQMEQALQTRQTRQKAVPSVPTGLSINDAPAAQVSLQTPRNRHLILREDIQVPSGISRDFWQSTFPNQTLKNCCFPS